jgi:hypothetical protein
VSDPTPVIAPYVPTYATYTPYVSETEFLNTNTGVDVSQLVPGGSVSQNQAAFTDLLARASSEADRICQKPLAATIDVVSGEYRIFRDGTLRIPVPYKPIVAVTSVLIGRTSTTMTAMTNLTGIFIGAKVVRIPIPGGSFWDTPPFAQYPSAYASPGRLFAQVTYVNGWMHSTLADAVAAAASSIDPASVVGAVPGLPFMIKDGASTEACTVDAGYTYGAASVPLASPLQYAHSAGATVSALPPYVKNAIIDLGRSLVKEKGSKAFVMPAVAGGKMPSPPRTQGSEPGGTSDYKRAERTLLNLRRSA